MTAATSDCLISAVCRESFFVPKRSCAGLTLLEMERRCC